MRWQDDYVLASVDTGQYVLRPADLRANNHWLCTACFNNGQRAALTSHPDDEYDDPRTWNCPNDPKHDVLVPDEITPGQV